MSNHRNDYQPTVNSKHIKITFHLLQFSHRNFSNEFVNFSQCIWLLICIYNLYQLSVSWLVVVAVTVPLNSFLMFLCTFFVTTYRCNWNWYSDCWEPIQEKLLILVVGSISERIFEGCDSLWYLIIWNHWELNRWGKNYDNAFNIPLEFLHGRTDSCAWYRYANTETKRQMQYARK